MGTYTVQAGDTLGAIATNYGVTVTYLWSLNPQISDPNLIGIGEVINVPTGYGPTPPPVYSPPPTYTPPPQQSSGTATLTVDVRLPSGAVAYGAPVEVVRASSTIIEAGGYIQGGPVTIPGIPAGSYYLHITLAGYQDYISYAFNLGAGQSQSLAVQLAGLGAPPPSPTPLPSLPPPSTTPPSTTPTGPGPLATRVNVGVVVNDSNGRPLSGVQVTLHTPYTNPDLTGVTGTVSYNGQNVAGAARFTGLQGPAELLVTATASGYQMFETSVLLDPATTTEYNVQITLISNGQVLPPEPVPVGQQQNIVPFIAAAVGVAALVFVGERDIAKPAPVAQGQRSRARITWMDTPASFGAEIHDPDGGDVQLVQSRGSRVIRMSTKDADGRWRYPLTTLATRWETDGTLKGFRKMVEEFDAGTRAAPQRVSRRR